MVSAQADDGNRLLAEAAEQNAQTWTFSTHEATSFVVTYTYRIDVNADPNNPTVILRFPSAVEVSAAPLVFIDGPKDPPKR